MKAHILHDAAGNVLLMHIPSPDSTSREKGSEKHPQAVLRPGPRQYSATLDVPADLHRLPLGKLHTSVRVDLSGKTPRLIAKS
jgi:hypothetical protein